jgi:hypothetical protein
MLVIDCGMQDTKSIELAGQFVSKKLHEKLLAGRKTDFAAVVFAGTEETNNQLDDGDGQFLNINVVSKIQLPTAEMLKQLNQLLQTEMARARTPRKGDCVDAIVVATDMLISYCGPRKYDKMVYLFTDSGCSADSSGIEDIASTFAAQQVQLTVMYTFN